MARKTTLKVLPLPLMQPAQRYRVRIVSLQISKRPAGIQIELEHLDHEIQGLRRHILLPPLYSEGITASLFAAVGIEILPGKAIDPDEIINKTLEVCFEAGLDLNQYRISAAYPMVKKDKSHDPE
jgi:hypothetical protein